MVILGNRILIVILVSLAFLSLFGSAHTSQTTYYWTTRNQQVVLLADGIVYWTMTVTRETIFTQCRVATLGVEITNLETSTASLQWETISASLTGDFGSGMVSFTFGPDLDNRFPIPIGESRGVDVGTFEFSEGVPLGTFQGTIEITVNSGAPEVLSDDFQAILQPTCAPVGGPVGGTVDDPPYNVQLILSTAAGIITVATAAIVALCRKKQQ